jgi:hypothetical protein
MESLCPLGLGSLVQERNSSGESGIQLFATRKARGVYPVYSWRRIVAQVSGATQARTQQASSTRCSAQWFAVRSSRWKPNNQSATNAPNGPKFWPSFAPSSIGPIGSGVYQSLRSRRVVQNHQPPVRCCCSAALQCLVEAGMDSDSPSIWPLPAHQLDDTGALLVLHSETPLIHVTAACCLVAFAVCICSGISAS